MPARPMRDELSAVLAGTALLLSVPLVAGRFTAEVNWGAGDYAAAAALLSATGIAAVLVRRWVAGRAARMAGLAALMVLAGAVWAELAVGLLH